MAGLLAEKVAVVTGASRGIGEATARLFAQEGASLVLVARSESVEALAGELGEQVLAIRGDLCEAETLKAIVKETRSRFGRADILLNNAGILEQGVLGMIPMEEVRAMFEVNVLAAIQLSQQFSRLMARQGGGSIINVSSIAGVEGIEGISAYSASKAALLGFTRAAAKELAASQVRVNAITPGFIDTEMARQLDASWFEKRVSSIRMGRIGQPEDVARAALFFASDLSRYVTGQELGVDGSLAL